jgi:anti-sigma factor RsiW
MANPRGDATFYHACVTMSRLSEEDRANLVAFLDGELDEPSAQALEAKLGRDPQLRAEADAFKKTWELLDYLPRPEPSPSFTHRTLERLAVKETHHMRSAGASQRWSWLAPIAWMVVMAAALGGGVLAAHHLWTPGEQPLATNPPPSAAPSPQARSEVEDTMAKDWDMLKSFHYYEKVDDVEMLRQLNHKDFFGDE